MSKRRASRAPVQLDLSLTPRGELRLEPPLAVAEGVEPLDGRAAARLQEAFARGVGPGLLHLAAAELETPLPPAARFWRELGQLLLARLRAQEPVTPAPRDELIRRLEAAPPMRGGEQLSLRVLERLWAALAATCQGELAGHGGDVLAWLRTKSPGWSLVGRVHFHLAENKREGAAPFAFLATYTTRLGGEGKARHVPLGKALTEYSGAGQKPKLLELLEPVQRAAKDSTLAKELVESGAVFHPLAWSADEAYRFLKDVPALERVGVIVKVPDWWRKGQGPRPRVQVSVGADEPTQLGANALLGFSIDLALEGETLTAAERAQLLSSKNGLVRIKGRWVELDRERLDAVLQHWTKAEEAAADGLTFAQAMRLLAGAPLQLGDGSAPDEELESEAWSSRVAGPWLAEALASLRAPGADERLELGADELKAQLRPYQQVGVSWLWTLQRLGLGGCLADDMGLGKTIQVLALLLLLRRERTTGPSLLVAPASLIANWKAEAARFAPKLRLLVAHPSAMPAPALRALSPKELAKHDLVVTSYGYVARLPWAAETPWELVVLDEAQAIKTPTAKQTRACKALKGRVRLALTGTPIENRLADLWSLFDFVNPGLLGSASAFTAFTQKLGDDYGPLRRLVQPYVLRRLKSDPAVIQDLPDKTEVLAYCSLSRTQAALYGAAVKELEQTLKLKDHGGIARKGVVLSFITRFKQICNHPSHWLGDGVWSPEDSGKLERLRELCEEIAERQQKVLVFTQYREMCEPLAAFLTSVFGRPGLVLHGGTPVAKRRELVTKFQEDEDAPFFVLSLKAGGTGLNLTAASHVIHFDRWWNPAVEDQATDRAYRIGQRRNVLVHKFVCRGTVEERIETLIQGKRDLSSELLSDGAGGALLTELPDEELLRLVALDLDAALAEA